MRMPGLSSTEHRGGWVRQGITVPPPRRPKHSICGGELLLGGCRGSFAEYEQAWGLGAYSRSFCSSQCLKR